MKILVVGNDKIGGMAAAQFVGRDDIVCVVDKSSSLARVFMLVRKGRLSLSLIGKMFVAELLRPGSLPPASCYSVVSNRDLAEVIADVSPSEVILFRAGLIVGQAVLDLGVRIVNLHCCRLPDYGGIGTISKALRARAFDQEATLHVVTTRIDEGEVLSVSPYRLSPDLSYAANEEVAYCAGLRLLSEYLDRSRSVSHINQRPDQLQPPPDLLRTQ